MSYLGKGEYNPSVGEQFRAGGEGASCTYCGAMRTSPSQQVRREKRQLIPNGGGGGGEKYQSIQWRGKGTKSAPKRKREILNIC